MSSSSASPLRRLAMAWSNRRPCAESRIAFRPAAALGPDGFHRHEDRLRLQHHAFAAAERPVVHRLVPVRRPIAQVVDPDLENAGVLGPLDHAMGERPIEELGKNRQHVEDHGRFSSFSPSGSSTTIRLAAGSISTQIARTKGISQPPSTCNNPEPPPSCQPVTRPRLAPCAGPSPGSPPGPTGSTRRARAARARSTERAPRRPPGVRRRRSYPRRGT